MQRASVFIRQRQELPSFEIWQTAHTGVKNPLHKICLWLLGWTYFSQAI